MRYQVLEKNERHVESIARGLAKSKALYLATDPDREGEAIAWHLKEILKSRGGLDGKTVHRVVFYEITRNAVREAVAQPRDLSLDLVNAQQARRALDYLVGFNLSPLLWKKVRRGLSAGRVQSPALRMICEREEEIAAFVAQEYWTLEGEARSAERPDRMSGPGALPPGTASGTASTHQSPRFPLKLTEYAGQKVEQFSFTNETQAREVEHAIQEAALQAAGGRSRRSAARHRRGPQAAPAHAGAALYHLDPAAGSGAQARLQRPAHDAAGAAALRGRRPR